MKPIKFYKRTDDVPIGEFIKTKSGRVYEVKLLTDDIFVCNDYCGFPLYGKKCRGSLCYLTDRLDGRNVYFSRRTDLEDF